MTGEKRTQVCFEEDCFNVEIAQSDSERKQGLMYREGLKENEGMLFVYEEEKERSFWMKNVSFPLDIIWISKDKEVVGMDKNVSPTEAGIKNTSKYVLEVKAGTADKINLKIGDKVCLEDF